MLNGASASRDGSIAAQGDSDGAATTNQRTMIETHDLRRTFKSRKWRRSRPSAASTCRSGRARSSASSDPNGAGKTTTLRMLATLLTPTSGEAVVAGADLRREPQAGPRADRLRAPGRFHRPGRDRSRRARHPGPPVRDVEGGRRASGRTRSSRRSTSRRPPTATIETYSGGMKRRLDVGLGIVHRPSVLFLDEPTTGLDPQARARMWDEIRACASAGRRSS